MTARLATGDQSALQAMIPHVWADFAQMKTYFEDPFILDSAEGIYVYDTAGNRYLDTLAGTACVSVGHRNPVVIEAMIRQLGKMTFASPNASVNTSALRLVELLLPLLPPGFSTIKFFSGGSEANEGMLKTARQYFHQTGRPDKKKIIGRQGEAIGGTLACKAVGGVTGPFGPPFAGFYQAEPASLAGGCSRCGFRAEGCDASCAISIEEAILREGPETVAAVVGAPVGQTIWPPPGYWSAVREICDRYDVLLLYDEIVTGFGRLGTMWGADYVGAYPDLMAVGKGMSGGYAPLSALLIRDRVAEAFWGEENRKFDEGHTFNANPLSAAAGHAVLSYMLEQNLIEQSSRVGAHLLDRARDLANRHDRIAQVHGAGLWVTLLAEPDLAGRPPAAKPQFGRELHRAGRRHGLLVRPYPSRIVLAPPLTITCEEVDDLMERLDTALTESAQ